MPERKMLCHYVVNHGANVDTPSREVNITRQSTPIGNQLVIIESVLMRVGIARKLWQGAYHRHSLGFRNSPSRWRGPTRKTPQSEEYRDKAHRPNEKKISYGHRR